MQKTVTHERTFVDVSGYGHSGKSAVTDFLRQFKSFFAFPNHIEFELIRVPGGLLDLYLSICEPWNLIRAQARIDEFERLIQRIGKVQKKSSPISFFTASGHGYEQYFNDRFVFFCEKFLSDISVLKQKQFWPYDNLYLSPLKVFRNKLNSKFGKPYTRNVVFTNKKQFTVASSALMQNLFNEAAEELHTHVLLSNAFEPYDPTPSLNLAGKALAICVDRDPRDIYASLIDSNNVFVPAFERKKHIHEIKKQITGYGDIDQFIQRFRILKENTTECDDDRILRIRFEDFVTDFDSVSNRIKKFVGLSNDEQPLHGSFDIRQTSKNVGVWRKYEKLPEIIQIERELKEFCYQ